MKIKALKGFVSAFFSMETGEVKEIELDDYTLENWVENGLIEVVKKVKTDDVKRSND